MPESTGPDNVGEPTIDFTPLFDTGQFSAVATKDRPPELEEPSEPLPAAPAPSVVVPGTHQQLKRWTFVFVVTGVWIVAAAAGLGLFYWWFHSVDKTPPVFVLLIYLVVTTVGGLIVAMAQQRPVLSALALAIMSAPFASTMAAAVLYGMYFCEQASRCLIGVIPY